MMERCEEPQGHILTGIIGAVVGALLGAVVWVLVGKMGYVAAIVGFLIAFLSSKGYDLCKGRPGTVKLVVVLLCVILAVVVGTAGSYLWIAHDQWVEDPSFHPYFQNETEFLREIFQDDDVQAGFFKDLGMGLVFGALGAFGLIKGLKGKKQTQQEIAPATQPMGDGSQSSNDTGHENNTAAM